MTENQDPKSVLIVEDDDGWARYIAKAAEDARVQSDRVRTIEQAQQRLEQSQDISLVVIDVLFGATLEPRGIELARWMKQHSRWRDTPIIFCTVVSRAEIGSRLKELRTGNDVIFEKPFDFRELSDRIKALLGEESQ